MSVIQTIRNKYLGLMIASIVIALLGFLLMDALQNNGSNLFGSNDRSFGKVNGKAISNTQYLETETRYMENARRQNSKMSEQETEEVKQQAWEDLVNQQLLESEYEKLGIQVTNKELQQMLSSQYADPAVVKNFSDPNTGVFDPTKVKQFVDNLRTSKDTAQRKQWINFEKGLIDQRMAQKYTGLVALGTYIPTPFIESKIAERNTIASADFVKVPYTSVEDKNVTVTDADLSTYMKKYASSFTLREPMRKLDYVAFDVIPTSADTQASLGVINNLAADFASSTVIEEFIGKNSDESYEAEFFAKGRGKSQLFDTCIRNGVGSVAGPYFEDGMYKLFKVMDKRDIADSARVTHILIAVTKDRSTEAAEKLCDSLLKTVQNGGDISQLASQISDDGGSKAKGGDMGYVPRGVISKEFSDATFMGKVGEVKKAKSGYGFHIVKCTDQKAFQPSAKIAVFAKSLKASEATINAAYTKANQFSTGVNDKATFEASIKKAGLTKRVAEGIGEAQTMVQGIGASRDIVRWAYDAKTKLGATSGIKSAKDGLIDRYIVACLAETAEPGIAPVSMVRERLEAQVRKSKKAAMIATQYASAASLQDIATKAATTVGSADTILFAGTSNPVLGTEPRVIGACFNKANTTAISKAIEGNEGVYFVKVKTQTPSTLASQPQTVMQERMMMQMQSNQSIGRSIPMILRRKGNVKDNRGKNM